MVSKHHHHRLGVYKLRQQKLTSCNQWWYFARLVSCIFKGDSGGPIFDFSSPSQPKQIGLVSFGEYHCNQAKLFKKNDDYSAGLYSRISGHKKWLIQNICKLTETTIKMCTIPRLWPKCKKISQECATAEDCCGYKLGKVFCRNSQCIRPRAIYPIKKCSAKVKKCKCTRSSTAWRCVKRIVQAKCHPPKGKKVKYIKNVYRNHIKKQCKK